MSGGRYRLAPLARRDLAAQIDRLLVAAGAEVAGRFVEQARTSLAAIAEAPALGSPVPTRNHQLAGLRKRKITGFANVLVFYIGAEQTVRIIRIIHAAGDWQALLGAD